MNSPSSADTRPELSQRLVGLLLGAAVGDALVFLKRSRDAGTVGFQCPNHNLSTDVTVKFPNAGPIPPPTRMPGRVLLKFAAKRPEVLLELA